MREQWVLLGVVVCGSPRLWAKTCWLPASWILKDLSRGGSGKGSYRLKEWPGQRCWSLVVSLGFGERSIVAKRWAVWVRWLEMWLVKSRGSVFLPWQMYHHNHLEGCVLIDNFHTLQRTALPCPAAWIPSTPWLSIPSSLPLCDGPFSSRWMDSAAHMSNYATVPRNHPQGT